MSDFTQPLPKKPLRKGAIPDDIDPRVLEGRANSKAVMVSALTFFGSLFALGAYALANYAGDGGHGPAALHTVRMVEPAEQSAEQVETDAEAEDYLTVMNGDSADEIAIAGEADDFAFGEPTSELVEDEIEAEPRSEDDMLPFGQPMLDWFSDEFGGWGNAAE